MADKISLKNVTVKWANIKPKECMGSKGRFVVGKSVTLMLPSEEASKLLEYENLVKESAIEAINIAIKAENPTAPNFRADKLDYKSFLGYDEKTGNDTVEVKLTRVPSEKIEEIQADGTIKETTVAGNPDEEGNYKELVCNRVYADENDIKGSYNMPIITRVNGEETEYIPYGGSIVDADLWLDASIDTKAKKLSIYTSADKIAVTQEVEFTGKGEASNTNVSKISVGSKLSQPTTPTDTSKTTKKTTKTKVEPEENAVNKAVDYALSELVD